MLVVQPEAEGTRFSPIVFFTRLASLTLLFCLQRYQERSKQRLDSAILAFFQSFRRVYVGDQAMHSSKASTPADVLDECIDHNLAAPEARKLFNDGYLDLHSCPYQRAFLSFSQVLRLPGLSNGRAVTVSLGSAGSISILF